MTDPGSSPAAGSSSAFPFGLASGDPTSTSITLWTRPAARPGGVALRWWLGADRAADADRADPADGTGRTGSPLRSGEVRATDASDHTVHVTVDGLTPGTAYRYGFELDGATIEGRTRTLPERADQLRFVVACCSRYGWPGFERYRYIVAEEPAFVLHLGDYIYETGVAHPDSPPLDPPWECVTLDDYRRRHRQHRSDIGLQHLHAAVPFLATWDDHEVVNNAPAGESPARRRAGQQAWREWLPMGRPDADAGPEYAGGSSNLRTLRIGGLADLVVLDARYGGRQRTGTDGPALEPDLGPLLDQAQWSRVEEFVAASTEPWLLVASQVQVGPMTLGWVPSLRRPPFRRIVNPDQWDGHPAERERLYRAMAGAPGRAVVLSGDLHSTWSRRLGPSDAPVGHEFTAPSISGETFGAAFRSATRLPATVLAAVLRACNRGIDHLDVTRHGYLVCDLTAETCTVTAVLGRAGRGRRVVRTLHAGADEPATS